MMKRCVMATLGSALAFMAAMCFVCVPASAGAAGAHYFLCQATHMGAAPMNATVATVTVV